MDKVILCDLDGTVWDENEAIRKASLEILGKEFDKKDIRKLPKEIKSKIYNLAFTKYKEFLKPKENVIRFLEKKKEEGFLIFILTARLRDIEKETVESLRKFRIPYDQIIIRDNLKMKDEVWKVKVIERFLGKSQEIIFIDDKEENVDIVRRTFKNIKTILAENIQAQNP